MTDKCLNCKQHLLRMMIPLLILCMLFSLTACSSSNEQGNIAESPYDLVNAKVGVVTGLLFDEIVEENMENPEVSYFNNTVDSITALTSGKIDCVALDAGVALLYSTEKPEIKMLEPLLTDEDYGLIFQKNEAGAKLADEFNEQLEIWEKDGTEDEIINHWLTTDTDAYPVLDPADLPAVNGTIRANICETMAPACFISNNLPSGYVYELFYDFCKNYGYGLTVDGINDDALIAGVTSGKYDVSLAIWTITEERAESVQFSEPFYSGGTCICVYSGESSDTSFIAGLKESFAKTFIRENRWLNFIKGMLTTVLITVLSLVLGTFLGFAAYMWYRQGSRIAVQIMRFLSWLIKGMPEVLLLLILFYVIFGSTDISGTVVSIIAFSIVVMIEMYGITTGGVAAIDHGQFEASLALGYKPNKAFFRIIFPQALQYMLPSYRNMVVSLIKSTAIVGYVAVQDLTKVSDVIRSSTFEAFFPLIATAIIYYILAAVLLRIVNLIQIKLLPIRHDSKDILKGIVQ